jgi:NO-binding membrane sensor protein with MHYT domain/nitrogen-specific signal transduction histidine kinase
MLHFWRFTELDTSTYKEVVGNYDGLLVGMSLGIAIMAAYAMLTILERILANPTKLLNEAWLWFGSSAMGFGIWAMHFTGILAFELPLLINFNWVLTFMSVLPPIGGSYLAFRTLAHKRYDIVSLQLGAFSLAAGIGFMHFLGMEAMHTKAAMVYQLYLFVGSILVAHVLATAALYVRVLTNTDETSRFLPRLYSAILIGLAVSGMHYLAMEASSFYILKDQPLSTVNHGEDSLVLTFVILGLAIMFIAISIVGTLVDKRLEKAQSDAEVREAREHAILDSLVDALLVLDDSGRIEASNLSAQSLFAHAGVLDGEKIGAFLPELEAHGIYFSEDGIQGFDGRPLELSYQLEQGKTRYLEVMFSRMQLRHGLKFTALARDITQRKLLEHKLRQAQKLESIGQLAAGIAHEINTPTQYVSDNINFLSKGVGHVLQAAEMYRSIAIASRNDANAAQIEELEAMLKKAKFDYIKNEIPKAIEQSVEGLNRVTKIVRAMKLFSHSSDGEKHHTELGDAIESTVTICRNEWKYIAELEYDFEPDLPKVPLILDEFNQVILNLVVNAAHAIKDTLGEDKKQGHIRISARREASFVVVEVTDDGGGIPAHIQDKVFEPFFTTKKVGQGTGQGLNMAYTVIVEKHKGIIDFRSEAGKGTTFMLWLPLVAESDVKEQ